MDRIYGLFSDMFQEIILVTNTPLDYLEWDFHIVADLFDIRCSLNGIHAGLFYASTPHIFVTACDTPFLQKDLIRIILDEIEPRLDVIIPETSSGFEPLCAVYSKRCLKPIEENLTCRKLKIQRFLKKVRTKIIPENMLCLKDPDLVSFYNINTPEDMALAENMLKTMNE